jgi:hypothetical protein
MDRDLLADDFDREHLRHYCSRRLRSGRDRSVR